MLICKTTTPCPHYAIDEKCQSIARFIVVEKSEHRKLQQYQYQTNILFLHTHIHTLFSALFDVVCVLFITGLCLRSCISTAQRRPPLFESNHDRHSGRQFDKQTISAYK